MREFLKKPRPAPKKASQRPSVEKRYFPVPLPTGVERRKKKWWLRSSKMFLLAIRKLSSVSLLLLCLCRAFLFESRNCEFHQFVIHSHKSWGVERTSVGMCLGQVFRRALLLFSTKQSLEQKGVKNLFVFFPVVNSSSMDLRSSRGFGWLWLAMHHLPSNLKFKT